MFCIIEVGMACMSDHRQLACIMQVPPFKKAFTETMPYVDFLFGNETEAEAFAESEGWKTKNLTEIAGKVRHNCIYMHRVALVVLPTKLLGIQQTEAEASCFVSRSQVYQKRMVQEGEQWSSHREPCQQL